MVLQQTHSAPRVTSRKAPSSRLDRNRILGISSTLALNVLALLFLLTPMTLPSLPAVVEKTPDLIVVDIVPLPPVTPPPPEVVPVVRQPPRPQPVVQRAVEPSPAIDVPVLVDDGIAVAEVAIDAPASNDAPPSLEPAGPLTGVQLQYRDAPSPGYPAAAIRQNLEGTVLLRVLVDIDGTPIDVSIERSSGHGVLDREARRHVLRSWKFRPAVKDGQAVQAVGIVPIDFRLSRG